MTMTAYEIPSAEQFTPVSEIVIRKMQAFMMQALNHDTEIEVSDGAV